MWKVVARALLPENFIATMDEKLRSGHLYWTRLWSMVVLGHLVRRTRVTCHSDEDIALHSFA
jgi:hypothetical protein